ncbi:CaiB/BaiF CoA transferase family protein [Marinicaulis aureus]|uniref:CaiB/BaiF CoA transferase family protein n=1 Tax=Hyphococcus aureus TaxID=2666033 RepID=A0ABW1KVQ4_9PROT
MAADVSSPAFAGPLQGVRVLDLSRFMAGPYAGQLLGYLGADVIKVEEPGKGDPMRGLSKYGADGMSAHYLGGNACKKSLTLDLRAKKGREVFLDLVRKSDVVLENMRPGVMSRLGLDYETLRDANSKIILASVTGFGQNGPWKDWAAYDLIAQAVGGCMSLTGWPGEKPVKMGVPIGDLGGGVFAALAISAALFRRAQTGEGEAIDISMMDVQMSFVNYHAHFFWLSGEEPQPEGDAHPNVAPYQAFPTATGPLVVAVYGDPFWPGFCAAIEKPELIDDPRFALNRDRVKNRDALVALIEMQLAMQPRDYWMARLVKEKVPAAPLNSVGEAVSSPQAVAREMAFPVKAQDGETMMLLGNPLKFRSGAVRPVMPPLLGQHTKDLLGELLDMAPSEIEQLRKDGVI